MKSIEPNRAGDREQAESEFEQGQDRRLTNRKTKNGEGESDQWSMDLSDFQRAGGPYEVTVRRKPRGSVFVGWTIPEYPIAGSKTLSAAVEVARKNSDTYVFRFANEEYGRSFATMNVQYLEGSTDPAFREASNTNIPAERRPQPKRL